MTALVRAELLKLLLTRATWGFLAAAVLLAVLRVEMVIGSAGTAGAHRRGSTELAVSVIGASGTAVLVLVLLGVVAMTGELHHGTLTSTLLVTPDRRRLVVAKVVSAALVAVAVSAALVLGAGVRGATSGVVGTDLDPAVLKVVIGVLVGAAFWAWIGVAIGLLIRNQTVAVVVPLAWILVVETLLPAFGLRVLSPWTPLGATGALGGADAPGVLPMWAGFLLILGYALALTLPGTRRLVRSDVS